MKTRRYFFGIVIFDSYFLPSNYELSNLKPMAHLLADHEIKELLGSVIINGDISCIRPNSYVLRLGEEGEFLNATKEFTLGKDKKGIKVSPGHSVAVTAFEILDFRRDTIAKLYPENDLHGIVSPTTDLSREGIVAPTTHVDAGYNGTLNWTITNTSNEERRFLYKEKLFRLTIFKLEKGERPQDLYDGDYQGESGYVRSRRKGPPVGMKDSEWEDSLSKEGPEALLDNLLKSGYPWHALGHRLKIIDQQFQSVTNEYGVIADSIDDLKTKVQNLNNQYSGFSTRMVDSIKETLINEAATLQNRWLIGAGSLIFIIVGLILTITSNEKAFSFLKENGSWLGLVILLLAGSTLFLLSKKKKP